MEMKDELQGKLVEILTSIQTAASKASDFAMEQLPDIAQSYIAYGRAVSVAWVVLALCFAIGGVYTIRAVKRKHDAATEEYRQDLAEFRASKPSQYASEPNRMRYFEASDVTPFQYLPFLPAGAIAIMGMPNFMLVWFAPKVWLLQEIARLLK